MCSKKKKISGMKNIKSMMSTVKTPISTSRDSSYLELYILDKKKIMLEREYMALEQRKGELLDKLNEVKAKMKELQESEEYKGKILEEEIKGVSEKNWKTLKVDY